MFVEDYPHKTILLCEQCFSHNVSSGAFINEPVSILIDKYPVFNTLFNISAKAACFRITHWQELYLFHSNQVCADLLSHPHPVTGSPRTIGRFYICKLQPCIIVIVSCIDICSKTACCYDNTIICICGYSTLCIFCHNADNSAVFNYKLCCLCSEHYFYIAAVLLNIIHVCFYVACSKRLFRLMGSWPQ